MTSKAEASLSYWVLKHDEPADRLVVVFARTKSKIVRVTIGNQEGTAAPSQSCYTFTGSFEADVPVRVDVEFHGEMPVLVGRFGEAGTAMTTKVAAQAELGIEQVYQHRRDLIDKDKCPSRRSLKMFFAEFDRATDDIDKDVRKRLEERLEKRVELRASAGRQGIAFSEDTADDKQVVIDARVVAKVMKRAFAKARYASAPANADAVDFDYAFDQFALGQLHVVDHIRTTETRTIVYNSHGAPNGPFYFFFAEFIALLQDARLITRGGAINTKLAEHWMRAFTRTQELFLPLYWSGKSRSWRQYGWRYRNLEAAPSEEVIANLRKSYSKRKLAELLEDHSRHCAFAFADNAKFDGRQWHFGYHRVRT